MSENGEPDDGLDDLFAPLGGTPSAEEDAPASSPEAPLAGQPASADAVGGLTRRQLRERRAAGETGQQPEAPAVDPAHGAAPIDPEATPAGDAAASPDWDPAPELRADAGSARSGSSDTPWDPAPELGAEPAEPVDPQDGARAEQEAEVDSAVEPDAAETDPAAAPDLPATVPVRYDGVAEEAVGGGALAKPAADGGFPMRLDPPPPGRRGRRSLKWLAWFIPVVLVVVAIAGGGWYVWTHYEDKVRQVLGLSIPDDYPGTGNGESVIVTIVQGASGSDIAVALEKAGVTMSWKAFNDLANRLAHSTDCTNPDPSNGCWPVIQFGNYSLQKEMSAQSALDALLDPANKLTSNLVIPEGSTLTQVLDIISATTNIPLEELQTAAADPGQFGAANPANSLEGYLYPDTYQLDGSETATSILQRLVTETFDKLDALGVAPADRHAFLTGASMVQKESGPIAGDAAKVARVFQNRLAQGMKLQSDATVAYGAGNTTSIWNSSAQLNDAGNLYNTYVHPGLPIGPIAAPGAVAMDAWAHPADGDWLFFVPVNLKTGETHFSTTAAEHEQYVQVLVQWCEASAENAAYCK